MLCVVPCWRPGAKAEEMRPPFRFRRSRLAPASILRAVDDLAGVRVVVSAGGTSEAIDPVRVITNRSSGKMGLALAASALARGATVELVSSVGTGGLELSHRAFEDVNSLREALLVACVGADVLVMAAAVSDFRVSRPASSKLKKEGGPISLELVPVEDFTKDLPSDLLVVGFAAETEDLLQRAREKLKRKGYCLICANDVTEEGSGFSTDTNRLTLINEDGRVIELPLVSKVEAAHLVFDEISELVRAKKRA